MNIIEAVNDKNLFGQCFKNSGTWATWRVFLKGLFGLPMDAADVESFKAFTGRTIAPTNQAQECLAIVGRRGGKSYMAAITACYLALFRDWKPYLSPGETGHILIIATDRVQARNIFGYVRAILSLKIFKSQIVKELDEEIRLKNQIAVKVATCDFRTLRGYTIVCAVCDEMAFWRSEGMNPAAEILTALRPALATVPGSLLLGISSPYSKSGPLWDNFRSRFGVDDPDVLVWKAPTKAMNPTISDKLIERALREDHAAGKAEWLAEFRDDLESFLTTEMIEGAMIPDRIELPRVEGVTYYAFVDPSGGRADSFVLAIAHPEESGRIILDRIEERRPPLAPQDVARELSGIMKEYGCYECTGDRYAGEWVTKAFEDCDVSYRPSELNKSELYLNFEPLLAQGRVDLLDDKKMFNEFRGLERRTRSGGKDSVDHGPGCHDDVSNAVAGACVLASKNDNDPSRWQVYVLD
jgi:hypothetical protein